MLLLVSIQNTVVMYRIIYMVFYLFFILSFQVRATRIDQGHHASFRRSFVDLLWILEENRGYISFDHHHLFDDHSHWHLHLSGQSLHFETRKRPNSRISFQFEKVHVFLSAKFSEDLYVDQSARLGSQSIHFFALDRLASIGLEVVPFDVLAVKLLTPSTFLVVNILQLYYFHSGWMELITMPR